MNEIHIDGDIGRGPHDIGLAEINRQLAAANNTKPLLVFINSPGGEVLESFAIFDRFSLWNGPKKCVIEGQALSGASLIAAAFDHVSIVPNGFVLLHFPSFENDAGSGNAPKDRSLIAEMGERMAHIYAKKTGRNLAEIKSLMRAEKLLSATEARAWGLVSEILGESQPTPVQPITARAKRSATSIWQEAFNYQLAQLAARGRRVSDIRAAAMIAVDNQFPGLRAKMIAESNRV